MVLLYVLGKGQNIVISGPTNRSSAVCARWLLPKQKKRRSDSNEEKTEDSKKKSSTALDTVRGPCDHNGLELWERGSISDKLSMNGLR